MNKMKIPFNRPHLTGKEVHYIYDAVASGKISGNGKYTKLCQEYFENRWGFNKALLTTSCTDALEMCALLLDIKPGDEIIMPSYTFVSTAIAFVRQGAKIVFADSRKDHPGIDEEFRSWRLHAVTSPCSVADAAASSLLGDERYNLLRPLRTAPAGWLHALPRAAIFPSVLDYRRRTVRSHPSDEVERIL